MDTTRKRNGPKRGTPRTHGDFVNGKKSPLYRVWSSMRERCEQKSCQAFDRYGGRGIKVCEEWKSFVNFKKWALANGYTRELTIERKDNDGNYSPENCVYATRAEQNRNRRNTRWLTYLGVKKPMSVWARDVGISKNVLFYRLKNNWSLEKALTSPIR